MSQVRSIQVLTERRLILHNEHWIPHSFWMVLYVDGSTKLEWKGLMTYILKIPATLWLLNQIGSGFHRDADNEFHNPKAYSD